MNTTTATGNLRERRIAAGMTQRQLATEAGCSLTHLGDIEAGCLPRRSAVLPRVLDALKRREEYRNA